MELTLLNAVIDVSEATYPDRLHQFGMWQPQFLDEFRTNNFSGFVASDGEIIFLAFRGTQNNWKTLQGFVDSTSQWLTNTNFRQVVQGNCRVHKGFNEELNSGFDRIKNLLKAHGIATKPLIITGHSAGGGLATLAGKKLFELGVTNSNVYTFSAPKVGDSNFVRSYPVPLVRVEAKNDLVPFFPLHPAIYNFVGEAILFRVMNFVDNIFPKLNLSALRDVEYYHGGELLYMTDDDTLIHRSTISFENMLGEAFEDLLESIFDDEYESKTNFDRKIFPMPNNFVDVVRVVKIFEEVDTSIKTGKPSFFKDHGIDTLSYFLRKLLNQ